MLVKIAFFTCILAVSLAVPDRSRRQAASGAATDDHGASAAAGAAGEGGSSAASSATVGDGQQPSSPMSPDEIKKPDLPEPVADGGLHQPAAVGVAAAPSAPEAPQAPQAPSLHEAPVSEPPVTSSPVTQSPKRKCKARKSDSSSASAAADRRRRSIGDEVNGGRGVEASASGTDEGSNGGSLSGGAINDANMTALLHLNNDFYLTGYGKEKGSGGVVGAQGNSQSSMNSTQDRMEASSHTNSRNSSAAGLGIIGNASGQVNTTKGNGNVANVNANKASASAAGAVIAASGKSNGSSSVATGASKVDNANTNATVDETNNGISNSSLSDTVVSHGVAAMATAAGGSLGSIISSSKKFSIGTISAISARMGDSD